MQQPVGVADGNSNPRLPAVGKRPGAQAKPAEAGRHEGFADTHEKIMSPGLRGLNNSLWPYHPHLALWATGISSGCAALMRVCCRHRVGGGVTSAVLPHHRTY